MVRKSQVMSEHREPLSWKDEGVIGTDGAYRLCRFGNSKSKPFCDGAHVLIEFDGTEAADTGPVAAHSTTRKSSKILIQDEHSICVHSGFCRDQLSDIWKMRHNSEDPKLLAQQVVVIPDGPLWVTGGVPIEGSDGLPIETRNRVTICRCGA